MNSLRFGPIHGDNAAARKNRKLVRGVVAGIAHYGNCIGVPTIGGEIAFDESYNGNPLVNVLCLGVLKKAEIARGAASGVGNAVFYVGSETGRDGLAGAAFASRDLTEESKADRPAVQVGDPFRGKLLLEACLELLTSGAVAGIQDMGAAGLTCSTCETASRGGTGVQIDLALVPKRETGMSPYEILLSESQERMLIIVRSGEEERVKEVFEKWDLPYSKVGIVTDDGFMRVLNDGAVEVEIPAKQLADDAPVYEREVAIPARPQAITVSDLEFHDPKDSLLQLLAHPTVASKNWVFRQYDHTVRAGTVVPPGSDAAVFYVREADKFLAATTDCNHLYCRLDPREGAKIAVAEAARNLTCSGAIPLAVTDNLNFGNPYRPENFWQLREAVEGLSEACRRFETPVTGGNVSLYNESPEGTIDPTPTVGMIGLIEDERWITRQYFRNEGDVIFLIGAIGDEIGGSLYLKTIYGKKAGLPPRLNFDRELAIQKFLRTLIRKGVVKSAHDCSEGGLAVALAECCMSGGEKIGARICLPQMGGSSSLAIQRLDVSLFNESQSRIAVTVPSEASDLVQQEAAQAGIELTRLGSVGGSELAIEGPEGTLSWPLDQLHEAWYSSVALALSQQDL
jgi:phosphoribosylformylglycinamidine synthase